MSATEVIRLLTLISGLDPRMYADGDAARTRVAAWSSALNDIDATEAAQFVRRYYRNAENRYSILVGDIATACKPTPRWEDKAEHKQLAGHAVPMPDEVRNLIARDPITKAARQIPCPWVACKASAGNGCNLPSGKLHPSRIDAARVAA